MAVYSLSLFSSCAARQGEPAMAGAGQNLPLTKKLGLTQFALKSMLPALQDEIPFQSSRFGTRLA
jgi:hypothetical protein